MNKHKKISFDDFSGFDEYLRYAKELVSSTQGSFLNAPYEFKKKDSKNAVLLVHGLFDSPYGMKYLAQYFKKKGYWVKVILLPGHGTVPSDLIDINFKEWSRAVSFGIDFFKGVQNIYMAGLSLGAALCLNYCLKNKNKIKGLFLFSPAITLKTSSVLLSRTFFFLKRKWIEKVLDTDPVRYQSRPLNAIMQTINLLNENKRLLKKADKINVPVFSVLSADDESLDVRSTISFLKKYQKKSDEIYVYDEGVKRQNGSIIYFKNKYPEYRVVSVSHSCILTPPSDPLHGMNGLYKSCSHLKNRRLFNQCKEDPAISLGATNKKTIKKYGLVRKLSFNPGFVDLIDRLDIFIEGIR